MGQKFELKLSNPTIFFLSFFGTGFSPKAPGTVGTIATLPFLYYLGRYNIPFFLFIPFLIIITSITCFITDYTQKKLNLHDPQWIVIDESLGMFTAWLFSQQHSLTHLCVLFFLFRIFDIFKVWPATFFDKKVKHGSGTILDDIASGIYAGISYLILLSLLNF